MLRNCKGWPFRDCKKRKKGDVRMLLYKMATLLLPNGRISLLSSQSVLEITTTSCQFRSGWVQIQIPKPVVLYIYFMAWVDLADQFHSYYPVDRASHKWWRYIFYFLLHISSINSFSSYEKNKTPLHAATCTFNLKYAVAFCVKMPKGKLSRNFLIQIYQTGGTGLSACLTVTELATSVPRRARRHGQTETVFGCFTCNIRLCKGQCFANFHNF